MAELEEESINPETWTQKELLKHVYREIITLKASLDAANLSTKSDLKSLSETTKQSINIVNDKVKILEDNLYDEINKLEKNIEKLEIFNSNLISIYKFIGFLVILSGVIAGIIQSIKT